jgi:hypothetical protein
MISRSLFEDAVDAHWVTLDPEHAEKLYGQHHSHTRQLWIEVLDRHQWLDESLEFSKEERQAREELDAIFGKHGTKSWTTLNIFERVKAIEHLWSDGGAELRLHRDVVHRSNNQHLHASAPALNQTAEVSEQGDLRFHARPSPRFVDQALIGASWAYLQTLSLAAEWFELPIGEEIKAWSAEWGKHYRSENDAS